MVLYEHKHILRDFQTCISVSLTLGVYRLFRVLNGPLMPVCCTCKVFTKLCSSIIFLWLRGGIASWVGLRGCLLVNFFVGVYCVLPRARAGSPSGAVSLGRGVSPSACVGRGRPGVFFLFWLYAHAQFFWVIQCIAFIYAGRWARFGWFHIMLYCFSWVWWSPLMLLGWSWFALWLQYRSRFVKTRAST